MQVLVQLTLWHTNGRSKAWQFGGGGTVVGLQVGQSHCSCRAVAVRQEGIAFWSSLDAVLSVGRAVHRAENIVEQRFGRQVVGRQV